uniref:PHD-type domain-containing protein n=1 Tax=Physcomitrium patens TaxID=3218 RepID=A0A7I4E7R5_PHYPA
MDRFGYQDLLSKCILGGLPEGRDLKSSSRLEVNAEPPAGAGRFSENPVSGSKEDTSGAAEADVRNWTGSGIDGTAVEQRSSQELNIPKGVSISHMLGKPWRAEAFKIDGVPRSLLTSGEIGTNFRADVLENNIVDSRKAKHDFSLPVFSFRSLLEGAVCVRSPNTTQSSVGLDNQGVVLHVEHQNCTFLAENRALPDQRRLLGEGNSAICAGSPASPCRRDQKILLVEVMTESSKGQNTALCSHDSGLLNGATVGDSVPHVSYSSLLQAQLSESVLKTRTGAFYKKPRDVERHSLLVNLQSQSAAVNGRFLSLMTQTNPVLPSDAELVDEKTSDIRRSKETSRDISVHDSRSADNVSGRNTSDLLETATVPVSLVLTRTEEDPARSNFVVKFASPLMADPIYTDEDMLDACISLEPSDSLSLNDSRLVGRASKRVAMEYSHAPPVTAPPVSKPSNAEAAQADNVMELANSLVNDSTCINEGMLDAHLPRGSSNAPDLDEARLVDNLVETDYIDSSEVAAVPASSMLTRKKQVVLPAEVLADPASSVVSESTCIVEEVSDLKRFEELSRGFALEVLRFPDNVANGDILDLSRRVDAPSTLVMVDRASFFGADCVLVDSTLDVQSPEEPSQRLGMEESRSTELVLVMEGMNPSAAAEVTASHVSSGVEDVPPGEVAVKKGPGLCEDSVISTEQGKHHLNVNCILNGSPSVNPSHGLVLDKRQQAPLEPLDIESLRAPGQFNSVSEETLFESFCQAGLNQSGYTNEDSVEVSRDNVCGNQIKRRTSSVLRKYGTDYLDASRFRTSMGVHASVQGPVVEKPADLPNDEILRFKENNTHSLNAIIAVVDFPLFLHSDGQGVDRERQFVPGFVESATFHVGGRADLVDIGTVVECSLEAGLKQTENVEALLEEQEDDREREIQTPSSAGNVASQSGADINFHYITLEEELNVSKDKILHTEKDKDYLNMYALVKKSSSFTPLNVGILPFSDSKVVEQGLGFTRIGSDSQEFSLLEPVSEKLCALYEVERSHEAHVGKIVNDVTESGNSGVLADQLVSTDPGAISSRQRQVFLQDSDPTMSGSLESVQVTGAESGATRQQTGRSVQSSQGKKFKEIHLDDLGDRDANQHNDHFRHLDDLEDNEEQPYASPLIVAVNHQLAGAEVRAQKKKRRPRAHNLEKALQGTGNSHFRISGSKRKRGLHIQRDGGNRCRRNQHIDLDHPVPVFIEGRDEGFEETDRSAFLRWLLHQDEGNGAPSPTTWKRPRRNGREMKKPIIVIPSFRVVADYEGRQQAVENQQKLKSSIHENVAISSTARQSDYDMDDEDERWLHSWNKRLAAAGSNQPISEDKFEEIIELLERSAQLEATPTVDDLGQPVSGGTLPNTSPSDINPATSGVPVLENAPTLSTSTVRSGHHPQTGGRQKISTSSIRYDCLGGVSTSPTSAVRFHSWTSKNEKIICKTVADTVIKRPSERLLQKSFEPLSQKSTDDCCVCNEGENDKNNPVYTCKNCFMHVHQSCYGIREKFRNDQGRIFAPPNWFCRICEAVAVGVAKPNVSCVLCRKRGGALKQTVSPQKWAHVACALYTPETFFVDPDAMEPIDGIVTVVARAQERQDRCGLCGAKKGICSLCSVKDCRVPFHISCGVSQGASFESLVPHVLFSRANRSRKG